jgi:hypothetical protein
MVKRLYTLGKQAGFNGLFAGLGPRMSKSHVPSLALFPFAPCARVCFRALTPSLRNVRSHDRRSRHGSIRHLQVYQGSVERSSRSRDP